MRILVVDDEEIILQLVEKILIRAGHVVLLSKSGKQSLEIFEHTSEKIDLVLLDLNLNLLSGYEILERMRKIDPTIPCIFSSGNYTDIEEIPDMLKSGSLFLGKPYRASALIDIVEQAITAKAIS